MAKKSAPETQDPPEPTPLPTPEAEREPESAAVRDSRSAQLKALRGHAGTRVSNVNSLSPANAADTLGIARQAQTYA